jgi:hypothetical protein
LTIFRTNVERIQWKPLEEKRPSEEAPLINEPISSAPTAHGEYCYSALWRSALLPSWGQFYKKDFRKGFFIAGTQSVLIAFSIVTTMKSGSLSTSHAGNEKLFQDWQHLEKLSWLVSGSFYIYNLLDALVYPQNHDSPTASLDSDGNGDGSCHDVFFLIFPLFYPDNLYNHASLFCIFA